MHTLLDLRGSIPIFIHLTDGLCHYIKVLDHIVVEPRVIYAMDNFQNQTQSICKQTNYYVKKDYPDYLRWLIIFMAETDKVYVFLTNNLKL